MSVAPTNEAVVEKPGKMGVTSPTVGKEMEADVQRKMKLWGIINGFRDGRMPDNRQIDSALEYAIGHSPVDLDKLSPEGRTLIADTRDILETMRMIVQEKNADELFQNAVWTSYSADPSRAKQEGVVSVSKEDAKKDANTAAQHLRVLITLFLTNSEARKIISDFGIIARDLFATGAANVAQQVRPTDEQKEKLDHEAPSKQWIGPDGKPVGANTTPELQLKGPNGAEIRYHPKDSPSDAKVTDTSGQTRSAGQAYDQAQQAKSDLQNKAADVKESAKQQASSHADDLASSRDPNAPLTEQRDQIKGRANEKADGTDINQDQAKDKAKAKVNELKNKIPEEHREKVRNVVNDSKQYFKDEFPEERRDQYIYRLKKVVVECQEHKDYQEAMEWLLDALENYKGHAKHTISKGTDAAGAVTEDPSLTDSTYQFRTLLERFANGRSMDGIFNALDNIYTDAKNDDQLRGWFSQLDDYVRRILLEPGFILEEESDREGRELRDKGKSFFTDKYRGHWDTLADEIKAWFQAMGEDPLNVRFGDDWKRLTKDLLFNEEGNLEFKPHLWSDIRTVILPTVIRQIGYVPIPRAEYSDDKIDLVIENLVLSGPNLFPNIVSIEAHNSFKFSPCSEINKTLDVHHHRFRLGLSQIQADIRDVAFAFRRKSGWPRISDHGLADVVLAGQGISIDVELESVENRRDTVFKTNHVNVKIDTLKFSIRDSKHDLLYKFIKGVATGVIKKAITAAIQNAVHTAMGHLDDQLVQVRDAMDEAKQSDETNRRQALKDLYARKKDEAASKKEAAVQKTGTFRVVGNRDSQLNPDLGHDSKQSIAKRMFKVEDAAHSGQEWRSPVFDLFDARHPAVTGQHHPEATQGAGAGKSLSSKIQTDTAPNGTPVKA
ncbi:hypothetical protein M231_01608 [Tremella mesenterica]|uniref:Uncharacterized protein n=1 Tax=Tremella mesenterica TaxID=5217 RepID=A0A4Q1BT25_TREME|nr:hypothetical protein M231_01608 [Tremella mesenterica]